MINLIPAATWASTAKEVIGLLIAGAVLAYGALGIVFIFLSK